MKHIYLFLFFIFCSFQIHSQVTFEKGYFINNSNETITGLIKNTEWRNNPSYFTFKLNENSPVQELGIEEVKEYGLGENVRFVRKTVKVDQTSDKFRDLTSDKEPDFQERTVFLRQLLDGNAASLYIYQDPQVRRFFYSKENSEPEPFIFKNYLTPDNKVAINAYYKQQLLNDFNCGNLRASDLQNTEYNQNDLLKVLKDYNTCRGESFEVIEANRAPGKFTIAVKAGLNHSSFSVEQVEWERTIEIDEKITYTFGLEGEYLLPAFNQKLAFIVGAFYTSYSSSGEGTFYNGSRNNPPPTFMGTRGVFNISYSSLELPVGFRYFLYLSPSSKMTLTAAYSPSITFDNSEIYSLEGVQLKPDFKLDSFQPANFLIGAGYEYNSKISLEARYFPRKNMVYGDEWDGGQKSYVSVLLGYKIF